jgi:amino acid adenylation domain-containing protein
MSLVGTEHVESITKGVSAPACATLRDLLATRAAEDGARPAYAFLPDGETEAASFTWSEVERAARSFAARLQARGGRNARVLIAHPPGLEFVTAFLGCMMAGAIAVPCAPPAGRRSRPRFCSIARNAEPAVVVTSDSLLSSLQATIAEIPELAGAAWLTTGRSTDDAFAWADPGGGGDELALLQYTSGSTSAPRGILLTHEHLLRNLRMIRDAFAQSRESVVVGWLPLFHDMGLIGNVLSPLFTGARCILMPPPAFLQRPVRWLRAITKYGATTSGGPDFAFSFCAARIDEEERDDLDLSGWRTAFSGSEPVRPETLDRFTAAFGAHGFRREAFVPCYGLAEATLLVSGANHPRGPRLLRDPEGDGRLRVSCGPPAEGLRVLVVDPERKMPLPEGRVGELWVSGPSVGLGYWRHDEDSGAAFGARTSVGGADGATYLRTGDLGFIQGDDIAVTGRLKDLIVLRGRNHYPRDIESTIESVSPSLRPGSGAAFGVEAGGEERLVVVHELERAAREDLECLIDRIRAAVAEAHEVQPYGVLLLGPGRLPRTTSGKVQRCACAAGFAAGTLEAVAVSILGRPGSETVPVLPVEALIAATPKERLRLIESHLASLIEGVVGGRLADADFEWPLGALGLDSLGAVSVKHSLDQTLGVSPELSELLGSGTVRTLARSLSERWEAGGATGLFPPVAAGERALHPTPGQRALWLHHRLSPGSSAYHLPFAGRLESSVDLEALERALSRLVERHESLRSRIDEIDGEPVLRVDPAMGLRIERTDARHWTPEELRRHLDFEARWPFDLSRGPLLRAHLFQEAGGSHILSLVVHHVAVDFWSLTVLLDELGALYAAERAGAAPGLPEADATFADFARVQEELLAGTRGAELEARWRTRLIGAPAGLSLPIDRPHPTVPRYDGERLRFELGSDLSRAIRAMAAREGTTSYSVLLTGFAAFLARISGQEDLVVGSPAAGRPAARFANVVGYFTNLVPLRVDLTGNPSFSELLRRTRERILEALELQDLPLPALVERLQPEREPGRTPLFQVVLAYQRGHRFGHRDLAALALGSSAPPLRIRDLEIEPLPCHSGGAPFEITLMVVESPAGLRASLDYRTDLFDRGTAQAFIDQFLRLIEAAVREPSTRLSRLPLLSGAERDRVVDAWNATQSDYPRNLCVHELVEAQARLRPEKEAVRDRSEALSYRGLVNRARSLARELRRRGIRGEDRVGVLADGSVQTVVALLGVLEAGGAYVPLDGKDPDARLVWVLRDAQVRVVVSTRGGVERARAWGADVVELEQIEPDSGESGFGVRVSPEQLAYVIYTSGSTGAPKGVMVPHRAIVRLLWGDYARFGPEETFLSFAPLGFDASTFEIWGALAHGARLVLAPPGTPSLVQLGELIRDREVSTLWLTAGLFHLMVEERLADLRGVRQLLAGGDVLSPAHVRSALEALPGVRLVNGYGPTEATTFTCCHVMRGPDQAIDPVPIGRPIANSRAYVLDRWFEPTPVGSAGELWIGGDGLARGYLGSPALTAERFVPDPFGPHGSRLYRTGDKARWREDGALEFLGRIDGQVKVRGFRVEPGEVEAALAEHPHVGTAAVIAHRDGAAGAQLIAWVVPRDRSVTHEALREELGARLPAHLVPTRFVLVDRLPLTPNGKVDRRALARTALPSSPVSAGPRTDLEHLVADLWRQALGTHRVGLDENFFDLGAHSLLLAKVHAQLCDRLGRAIPIVAFFHHPTVRALASHLAGEDHDSSALEAAHRRGEARREAASALRRRRGTAAPEKP